MRWWHAISNIVCLCVQSKGDDCMPILRSIDHVNCPGIWWHFMPKVVQLWVMSKGYYGMPRTTTSDCVCCPRALMACYAQHLPTMCTVHGWWWNITPAIIHSCVHYKSDDGIQIPTLSYLVCFPKVMIAWHTCCHPYRCVINGKW